MDWDNRGDSESGVKMYDRSQSYFLGNVLKRAMPSTLQAKFICLSFLPFLRPPADVTSLADSALTVPWK